MGGFTIWHFIIIALIVGIVLSIVSFFLNKNRTDEQKEQDKIKAKKNRPFAIGALIVVGAFFAYQYATDTPKSNKVTQKVTQKAKPKVEGNFESMTKISDDTYFLSDDREWYARAKITEECIKSSPADMIKTAQGAKYEYDIKDVTVDGTTVQSKVSIYGRGALTYYRSKALCEKIKQVEAQRKSNDVNKYK